MQRIGISYVAVKNDVDGVCWEEVPEIETLEGSHGFCEFVGLRVDSEDEAVDLNSSRGTILI